MVLMILSQGDLEFALAAFDSLDSGRSFAASLPGYSLIQEETEDGFAYEVETLNPGALPDYLEVPYKGHLLPVSRFMLPEEEPADIFWQELPYLDQPGQGLVVGSTRVDAYRVNNEEVKTYITKREQGYDRVRALLEQQGYRVWRDYAGSEDGEAILCQKRGAKDETLLAYLDPDFQQVAEMSDQELADWLQELLG